MGIVSEVKCHRCDRRYSGFRSRCPYCGARRSRRGKRASESGNSKAKLMIGVLLLIVLIVAVIILLSQSGGNNGVVTSPPPTYNDDEGISSITSSPSASVEPTDTSTPEPTDEIESFGNSFLRRCLDRHFHVGHRSGTTQIFRGSGRYGTDARLGQRG